MHHLADALLRHFQLSDDAGHTLSSGERSIFLQPFANDRALIARVLAAERAIAGTVEQKLPASAAALRRDALLLEVDAKAAAPLQDSLPGSEPVALQAALDKTSALVARASLAAITAACAAPAAHKTPRTLSTSPTSRRLRRSAPRCARCTR